MVVPSRDGYRPHALDGALLWFHPRTGVHVRWDGPETRSLRRAAPRVVLFGITNRCNLTCSFCSRDLESPSAWTVESAFQVLAELGRRGTLEVAFGGGEPLAFRGFDELVTRLAEETALALHFTTNGTLLTPERLARLRPHMGEIRISIYDDLPWEDRVGLLAGAGGEFGANVLVTPERLARLPKLLARLAELGCKDVALLRYVGPDPDLHLTIDQERQLATVVGQSPLRTRLSVCFGDRLDPVPRLFQGTDGDCGAGRDFAVITSDKKVKACSFHQGGFPVQTAEDILQIWNREREALARPSTLPGCARPSTEAPPLAPGVRVWKGFSGNNSGDCVLVGRFEKVEDAEKYMADLLPDFRPTSEYPEAWQTLFEREGIPWSGHEIAPESMARVGPSILLYTDMTLEDDFPALRALLWKRGGRSVYSGIHVHDPVLLGVGMGFENAEKLEDAQVSLGVEDLGVFDRRGLDLYGTLRIQGAPPAKGRIGLGHLHDRVVQIGKIAEEHGAKLAAEIVPVPKETHLPTLLATRVPEPKAEHLFATFSKPEEAEAAAGDVQGEATAVGRHLLTTMKKIHPRVGFRVQRAGGTAEVISADRVMVEPIFYRKRNLPLTLEPAQIMDALRPYLPGETFHFERVYNSIKGPIETTDPHRVLKAVRDCAKSLDLEVWIALDSPDRLAAVLERLRKDLVSARRGPKRVNARKPPK